MYYWGELISTEPDPSAQRTELLKEFRTSDVSMREDQITLLQNSGRKVVVLTPCRGKGQQIKRITLDLKKDQVVFMVSGQAHVVLVTERRTVSEWKRSDKSNVPRVFSSLSGRKVAQVACGNFHSIVLTKDGQLFTWGENSSGQLGLGEGESSSSSPQPLTALCGIPLAQISAGGNHSFALSQSGSVFSWGKNGTGQLGLGDTEARHVPVCVKSLNKKKVVFISCGEDHTAVLTKEGLMFTFGSGCYGQLGHNSLRDELQPRIVAEFWGSKVSQIGCGRHHTLALVQSSNKIFSFGCGEQGQLGNESRTNQCVPVPVHLPSECNTNGIVKQITAGGNHSAVFFCNETNNKMPLAGTSLSSCTGTEVLNDAVTGCWISAKSSKERKIVQREIRRMFSSPSCINGSFIEKSSDKHYKTSRGISGLDLSLARLTFEKMAKRNEVLLEVEKVVEEHLLPSLGSTAAGVEALRVYLILPELLRVLNQQQRGKQLAVRLASTILKLDQESMDALTSLWTRLPYNYYKDLVKAFHTVSEHFMSLMTTSKCDCWTEVTAILKVLQKLYTINSQRVTQLTDGRFHSRIIIVFFNLMESMPPWELGLMSLKLSEISKRFMTNVDDLICYPFILDMKCKRYIFTVLQSRNRPGSSKILDDTLCVRREAVLEDTVTYLKSNTYSLALPIKVKFSQEDGTDNGGVSQEFFTLLGQDITKASNLVQASEDSGLFWFSEDESSSSEHMYHLGIICGMAFYNHFFMNIGFPLALFKKLLDHSPTFRDLEELSPVEARSLKQLMVEDEEVLELLYLDFTVKGKELVPNGAEIPVTKANRQKYVDLYVDFVFNKSVENQFHEFARGFSEGSPFNLWKMYQPEELRELLYGTADYKWKEFQEIATYDLCGPSDELIQNFWTVFFELDEGHQKKFLTFLYGTDRLPIGGLSKLSLKIVKCDVVDADERFPTAQTCFGILHLPNYSNIDILRTKLVHAITFCEVFGQK